MVNNTNNRRRNNNSRRSNNGNSNNNKNNKTSKTSNNNKTNKTSNNNKNNKNNNNGNNINDYNDTTNQSNKRGRGALAPDYGDNSRKNHRTSQSGPRENDSSPSSAATTVTANGAVCQHPMCIELAHRGVQRTHADAWCFRFTNPKRFESILRQQRRRGLLSDPQSCPSSSSLTVPDKGQQRQQQQPKSLVAFGKSAAAAQSHMGELDDDLKITDYLYMKDQKLQPATTSTSTRDAGFPHSTTWRYMFDEGGEEPAPAPVPAIANGNGKNNGGLVTSALSGSTQTQSNLTSTMSRSARQRARRAARKAEVRNNTISCNTIGGSGDGNGSSLNTSKQQPQKSHTKNTTAAAPAVTRTRVMDGRGMWTWDDECDEWDRPYNIQEAQDVLAFMDRLNWESQHRVRNSEYSLTPSPPPTPKVAARLAESSVVRKGSLRVGNVTASASAVPVALKKHYVVDPLTRAVAVHTGALPAPRSFTGGFRGAPPGDIRIALPVTINGVVLTALLVTGRAKSCIDRQVATAFGLRVWCDPALRMIDMYRTAKTQHTCNAVEASCNGHSVKAILDVDDLKYYDFHIGADLFHAFGFFITFCK